MSKLESLSPKRVFAYFEEICAIPHGSENMEQIAQYCLDFANKHNLSAVKDDANNVIIFKNATEGYENCHPVILQGHLDMVCQKDEESAIDFKKDGLDICINGDYIEANGTTLGGDNGIAVAMILAILENSDIPHPPIEAVFTTDEEIGMCGAIALDASKLKSKRMINLDAEEDDTLTVSCAGGSDFKMFIPITRNTENAFGINIILKGLKGGHSGVEINSGRVNANVLAARLLNHMYNHCSFKLIDINGGDKGNAIPNSCSICISTNCADTFREEALNYLSVIKNEISERESDFNYSISISEKTEHSVIDEVTGKKLISALLCVPNGVCEMSAEIEGLVESSQNLGVLKTDIDEITLHFTLRSNKNSALSFLEERMKAFSRCIDCRVEASGHYPPWEFKSDSVLQEIYKECFEECFGFAPKVEAIHAGLECGIFASKINGIDCIAMGPSLYDVHTVNERLSISSTEKIYKLLIKILERTR